MTEGKLLPCESESPGFLMVPSNCSLIRGPLMSCFPTHLLAKPCLRGIFKLSPLKTISSPPLAEGVEYILFGKQFFVPNLNPSCCVSSESVFGIPRLLLPIWKRGKKNHCKAPRCRQFCARTSQKKLSDLSLTPRQPSHPTF